MSAAGVIRIGLLGCGTVGSAVARRLLDDADGLSAAAGVKIELVRVAVLHYDKPRPVDLPEGLLTTDTYSVVTDPAVDVVVEAIGGIDIARRFLLTALVCNKSVVTANKELVAASGWELSRAAAVRGQEFRFDAAVGGAAPIVSVLRGPLAGEQIDRIVGVLNGTSNFVLTVMEDEDCSLDEALDEARGRGLTEADPSADVDGHDAAAKLAILTSLAWRGWVPGGRIRRWGIRSVSTGQLRAARERGHRLRLVSEASRVGDSYQASVRPALLPEDDPLAQLIGAQGGAHLVGSRSGRVTVLGIGAGGDPSASSVIGDIVATARWLSPTIDRLPTSYLHEWVAGGAPAGSHLDEIVGSPDVVELDRERASRSGERSAALGSADSARSILETG